MYVKYLFKGAQNHNEYIVISFIKDQDPAAWDTQFTHIVRQALLTRYTLLPYFYNVFKDSHVKGTTVGRALMFEYVFNYVENLDIDRMGQE